MTRESAQLWLKIGSATTMFFGVLIAAASTIGAAAPTEFLADLIFFPIDGAQSLAAPETRLMNAIGGGVLAGWGLLIWKLSTTVFVKDPALAKQLIVPSILTWFVIDSTGSVLAGAPLNALFNVSFLLVFCVPLWRSA